jgi:hypothetical protein
MMWGMDPHTDQDVFDWIRNGRTRLQSRDTPGWKGNFVSSLIPAGFEAHAKVLHRIEAYHGILDNPLTPREDAILQIPHCDKLKSLIKSKREEGQRPQVFWRELCEQLGVPFQPEINLEWFRAKLEPGCWPRFLAGPDMGNLAADECGELVLLLRQFSDAQKHFFRFAEMPLIDTDKQLLFSGSLQEVSTFLNDKDYQYTPEYWWPGDRSWYLCSDYDLVFTVIGGPKKLIASLLGNEILECIEVTPQTRIDELAPMP